MALLFVLFFTFVVLFLSIRDMVEDGWRKDLVYFRFDINFFRSIPLCINAYACHVNLFPIYSEMKEKTFSNMHKAMKMAFGFSAAIYILSGLFGYLNVRKNSHLF